MKELEEDNAILLYDMIHDFITQNEMEIGDLIGVLEQIKLEFAITAMLNQRED